MAKTVGTTKPKITNLQKRQEALNLRLAGASYDEIGATLGITKQAANKRVLKAMEVIVQQSEETAEQLVEMENQRLDKMLLAVWTNASKGHLGAVDRVIKISERKAKLNGLDKPMKIAPTDGAGNDIAGLANVILGVQNRINNGSN